jgi:hypothetical protein
MPRTTAIALPLTLFLAWYVHVVNRAGNGPGLQWSRIPGDAAFTAAITGVVYVAFVLVALTVLYFTRIRGHPTSGGALVVSALGRFVGAYLVAVVVGIALAEWYCVADERAFERENARHIAAARAGSGVEEIPLYSRPRWWPGSAQLLVGRSPDGR